MIGSRLRQYVIAGKLGEGGMGVVWRARDTMLERDVALKVLPADGARDEVRRERFFREARAASALNHPNIVTVYEINADDGIDFIAMELVEGETLSARLARGPMAVGDALAIARQIADAVARAHRAGIVHRDLKPGNVMINHDGLVKVLDFGLAKVEERRTPDDRTSEATRLALTRAGTTLGTMGYMSPEQALGDPADARSDVFSFGVILYEMLAGALPFQGHTNTELLRALHFSEPQPLQEVRPDVASWVTAIVARSLAKDPQDRFATMGEVVAALRGSVVIPAAPRVPAESSVARPPRPARAATGYTVLALVSAVVFTAWALVPWDRVPARDAREGTPAIDASPSALTLDAAALLLRYDRTGNIDEAITTLQNALEGDSEYATAYAYLAQAYRLKNQAAPDDQWVSLAREHAQRALQLNRDLAAGHVATGYLALDTGTPADARTAFDEAVRTDPLNAQALVGQAASLAALKQDAEAVSAYAKAVSVDPDDWRTHGELGMFHYRRGRFGDAVTALEAARLLTPDNVVILRNLGAAYFRAGKPDEAASTLQRALEIRETGPVYTNLGNIRFFQGQYAAAAAAFEKALKLDANTYLVWGNFGDACRWAPGRRTEASEAYRRAIQLIDQQSGGKALDSNLATLRAAYLAKMGDRGAATRQLETLPAPDRLSAQMLMRVATARELTGDRLGALDAIERALAAGYPVREIESDPEFINVRADIRFHRLAEAAGDTQPR